MGLKKEQKNMAAEELKQVWNNANVVTINVATIVVAILEY